MSVYNKSGSEITEAFGVSGLKLSQAFDINGVNILDTVPDIPVYPAAWTMSEAYKAQVLNAMDYIRSYLRENDKAFAIVQFNDVHNQFGENEPNFIDYNKGYKFLSNMLFLGDLSNLSTQAEVDNTVDYLARANASKKLLCIGNHEYWGEMPVNPETLYKVKINGSISATYMPSEEDAVIYYYDDTANNVRYIVLNYYNALKNGNPKLDDVQLNWCASALESAGSKDIILCGHAYIQPTHSVHDGTATTGTSIPEQESLIEVINAYQSRGAVDITVDGENVTHDFSNCTGDFIMYTSGHYHTWLYGNDNGFNSFSGPSLSYAAGVGLYVGFLFFVIDKGKKQIISIMCSKKTDNYMTFTCGYGVG